MTEVWVGCAGFVACVACVAWMFLGLDKAQRELTKSLRQDNAVLAREVSVLEKAMEAQYQPIVAAKIGEVISTLKETWGLDGNLSRPVSPQAVAATCELVIDHLQHIITAIEADQTDSVVPSIETCCSVLEQLAAVSEQDDERLAKVLKTIDSLSKNEHPPQDACP